VYEAFYGLRERPFDLTPNPRYLFLAARQREALSNLRYGLSTPRGFMLLVGEAGTGKTTLVQAALADLRESSSRFILMSNPTLGRAEFYEFLGRQFGLSDAAMASKTRFLSELQQQLEDSSLAGRLTGLIVDEAQSLPLELLEEIRLLGNIETTTAKLLNIVLAGQPELADRLNESGLRQLKQRITLRCELTAFNLEETAAYIAGRIRIAGGAPDDVFMKQSVAAIYRASAGVPRTINVVCDNALIGGFAAQMKPVPARIVEEVCREFDLGGVGPESAGSPEDAPRPLPDPAAAGVTVRDSAVPMFDSVARRRRFSFF
jgi:general secretion pathway protein A